MQVHLSEEQGSAMNHLVSGDIRRVLYGGAAGSGKSFLICAWQIGMRLKYAETRGYIGRSTLKELKNSVLVTFFDTAKMFGLENGVDFRYNDNKSHINFSNGSRIILLDLFARPSDPNFDSLGSTEYTDGAIEEGAEVVQRVADLLLSRTRYKHEVFDLSPKQLITCNPSDCWLKTEIVEPFYRGDDLGDTTFIPALLQSNPNEAFVNNYASTLARLDDFDRARLLHGDWFAHPRLGGEFYRKFSEFHIKKLTYDVTKPLHISFDFNVHPYVTAVLFQVHDSEVHQIDEICLVHPRNTTKQVCTEIKRKYQYHDAGVFVYGDPGGRAQDTRTEKDYNDYVVITDELKRFHPRLRIATKAPGVAMRGNWINSILAGNASFRFYTDEKCKNTHADLLYMLELADGTKDKKRVTHPRTKVKFEKYGHCSDALDYFLCEAFREEFEAFARGGRKFDYTTGGVHHRHLF